MALPVLLATPLAARCLPTASPCGMENLISDWRAAGLNETAAMAMLNSWAPSTRGTYNAQLKAFANWCREHSVILSQASVVDLLNYLADRFDSGLSYNTLSVARAAISAYIEVIRPNEPVDSSLLSRAMKGFFRLRLTRPKHDFIWDVSVVVNYLAEAPTSSLKDKTLKCAMLLALCSPKRVSELASLALDRRSVTPTMWSFALAKTKNRRCGPEHRAQYTRFPGDSRICPIACLEDYLSATEALRPEGVQALLISYRAPHKAVTSATVARWLKCVLASAGIDAVFSAHSTRSASTSAALLKGATCGQIMQAANWATSSTFERHYHREPNATAAFQNAVLNNNDAS